MVNVILMVTKKKIVIVYAQKEVKREIKCFPAKKGKNIMQEIRNKKA